jgi:hypothetical protein
MIDYDLLVSTIAQWKAGQRPSAPPPAARPRVEPGTPAGDVEEIESGLVEVSDAERDSESGAWDEGDVAVEEDVLEDEVQVEE